jgi:hypothetical protein
MSSEGYKDLARKLAERMLETELKRPTVKKDEASLSMVDWAAKRSDWVNKNDSSVYRQDTEAFRGRGRGGWRGGQGRGRVFRGKIVDGFRGYRPQPY